MGVSPSAFRKWLKGEAEPSRERLVALARATGVGVAWLAEGEGPAPAFEPVVGGRRRTRTAEPPDEPDWSQYMVVPDRMPGQGPSRHMALRHDWIRSVLGAEPQHLIQEHATDDTMAPTIKRHDTMLVDINDRVVRSMAVYLIEISGQRLVRRVQKLVSGELVLISDNPACHPDQIGSEDADSVVFVGRVVWVGGPL